jgi:5-formyltetrahydrofolate cyclo-ligase
MLSKNELRLIIKSRIKSIKSENIQVYSNQIASNIFQHHDFVKARAICIYLPMEKEVQTDEIIKKAFSESTFKFSIK